VFLEPGIPGTDAGPRRRNGGRLGMDDLKLIDDDREVARDCRRGNVEPF
jgi:hypothetical protein